MMAQESHEYFESQTETGNLQDQTHLFPAAYFTRLCKFIFISWVIFDEQQFILSIIVLLGWSDDFTPSYLK